MLHKKSALKFWSLALSILLTHPQVSASSRPEDDNRILRFVDVLDPSPELLNEWCSGFLISTPNTPDTLAVTSDACIALDANDTGRTKYFFKNSVRTVNHENHQSPRVSYSNKSELALPHENFVRHSYREIAFAHVTDSLKLKNDRNEFKPLKLATKAPAAGDALTVLGYPRGQFASAEASCKFLGTTVNLTQDVGSPLTTFKIAREMECALGGSPAGMFGGPVLNSSGEVVGVLSYSEEIDVDILVAVDQKQKLHSPSTKYRILLYYTDLLAHDLIDDAKQDVPRLTINSRYQDQTINELYPDGVTRVAATLQGGFVSGPFEYLQRGSVDTKIRYGTDQIYFSGYAADNGLANGDFVVRFNDAQGSLKTKMLLENGIQTTLACFWDNHGQLDFVRRPYGEPVGKKDADTTICTQWSSLKGEPSRFQL